LLSLWRRLLESDSVGLDDDFLEAGGDSLLATQMMLEVERIVDHPVHQSILFEALTIRKLAERLGPHAAWQGDCVIHLHAAGDRCPFLFFHGGLGVAHYLGRLSLHLGVDQPILAIEPHGLYSENIPGSIEKMAIDRLKVILEKQSQGPYRLGGFCNGALVALEVARLLMAAGHTVEMLVLIDPPSVNARVLPREILSVIRFFSDRAATSVWRWMVRFEKLSIMSWRQRWAFLQTELSVRVRAWKEAGNDSRALLDPAITIPSELPVAAHAASDIVRRYAAVMSRYQPKPLLVSAVFYAAAYDGRGWCRLLPDLEVVRVPAGHLECVTDHLGDWAHHLRKKLQATAGEIIG
jgi:thioesterase domain-containing protein